MTNEELIKNDLLTLHMQLNSIEAKLDKQLENKIVQTELAKPHNKPPKTMYPAVCSVCDCNCEVPFKPRQGAAIKCRECWERSK